ncbi:MAG: hypothetical protein AAF598_16785 [Bacteroidota bacterium]
MDKEWLDETLDGDFSRPNPKPADQIRLYLNDGRVMVFYTSFISPAVADRVSIQGEPVPDGLYKLRDNEVRFFILESKIEHEYYIEYFTNLDGLKIEVDGSRIYGIRSGSRAWLSDYNPAPDGWYRRGWFTWIQVEDGVVVRKIF